VSGPGQSALTLGQPRLHLRITDSTNNRARELALAGAPHGTLVTAGEQTAGRGRGGRRWSAPPGSSVLMSLLLRSPPRLLPLIAAVAVCEVAGEQAQIKWPNDVVLARPAGLAKLAGILAEGRPQQGWAVLGIGLNVAVRIEKLPVELRASAATLGRSVAEVEPALAELLLALTRGLERSELDTLAAWRARDALRGRAIGWGTGRGRAQGIDGAGRLVVALAGGGHVTLDAGEVHLLQVG
jgi:BirA family biotin operon repressor/biotin-[acetyl-CoA-carboxylase] ligase